MTYNQLFAAVAKLIAGSFAIEVQTWCHRHKDFPDNVETKWSIYAVWGGLSCEGSTPEDALAALKEKLEPVRGEALEGLPSDEQAIGEVLSS